MNPFTQLGLSAPVIEVLDRLGYKVPTPVQAQAIPILLGRDPIDFIGLAQTGTGKTAAFGLPLIDLVQPGDQTTQAIIMAPTRELVQQTAQQLVAFAGQRPGLRVEAVYGGAPLAGQIKALRRPAQIVVATPGRLLDLIGRKALRLDQVKYMVLDEADEMLNMGFKEDIDTILSFTPEGRVTWLFSATLPAEIRRIVKRYMDQPAEVAINTLEKVNKDIAHKYVVTTPSNKLPAIRRFLDLQPDMRAILFCRTKAETQRIADELGNLGYAVEALHGDLTQAQRDAVMKRFKQRSMQLLIATDVAARGIDVDSLSHVLHHTLPDQLDSYTHRSGRTARAGKKGVSMAFVSQRDRRLIGVLEKKINVRFELLEVPSVEVLKSSRINHWAHLIVNTQVDAQADDILRTVEEQFSHLTKEDLLRRLITTQLDHLAVPDAGTVNLNEAAGEPAQRRGKAGFHRYFVNIGFIDGVTRADLVHFLSDVSGVDRNCFGDVSLQQNCAFFDVEQAHDPGLGKRFEGIEVEGRSIRVNRDDEGNKRTRPGYAKKDRGAYPRKPAGKAGRGSRKAY